MAPDLLYTDCFTQHGLVGPPQYYRVPAKVVPGDSNVYVAKTDRDVFVAVRGTDNDADWVADFVAVWAEANTLFGVTGSSVKLHAGFKDLYVSMADWLIPTVNNTVSTGIQQLASPVHKGPDRHAVCTVPHASCPCVLYALSRMLPVLVPAFSSYLFATAVNPHHHPPVQLPAPGGQDLDHGPQHGRCRGADRLAPHRHTPGCG
mgnify:CR=1 FL=1